MRHRQGNLDGTLHKTGDLETPPARKEKKAGGAKEQISHKKSISVKEKFSAQAAVAAKPPIKKIKKVKRSESMITSVHVLYVAG